MGKECVLSGYYGIFRPPMTVLDPGCGASVYTVTNEYRNILVIIPLTTSFYVDVVKIVRRFSADEIFIIAPDIGPRFISDYLACWYYIKKFLHLRCKIYSRYLPEGHMSEEFLSDIERNADASYTFVIEREPVKVDTINVQFSTMMVNTRAPYATDIILNDTNGRKLFLSEMNEQKAEYLSKIKDQYDEIHMPFISGTYPTMNYYEVARSYAGLIPKLRCNNFGTREELSYALSKGINAGKLVRL